MSNARRIVEQEADLVDFSELVPELLSASEEDIRAAFALVPAALFADTWEHKDRISKILRSALAGR